MKLVATFGFMLLLLVPGLSTGSAQASDYAVIVNAGNPVEEMTLRDARRFFLKFRKRWKHGTEVESTQVTGPSLARDAFREQVLRMSAEDLERHWIQLEYQHAQAPAHKFDSEAAVLKFVGRTPGALGVVSKQLADGNSDVRVVLEF